MAIILPNAFQPFGAGGLAQIAPRKILGADEWTDIIANDAYLRSSLCRRRAIGYANLVDPMQLETTSGSLSRYFELFRGRFGLSAGRDAAFFDYDASNTVLRVRHRHISELQSIQSFTGGTGYTAGDVLTVVGGTGTAATLTVDTVDGSGVITAMEPLTTPGNYTAFPRSAVVSSGPETIVDGGTGYTVSDVLTVVGGTGTAATLTVGTVTSGSIDTLSAKTGGDYTASPFDVVLTTGGGTGARFKLNFGDGAFRNVTVTGGSGTGAVFNITRDIIPAQFALLGGRTQGTFSFTSIPETEYDLLLEARNTTNPGTSEFFALRYREKAILLADL